MSCQAYLDLITHEHLDGQVVGGKKDSVPNKPKFTASVLKSVEAFCDSQDLLNSMSGLLDLNTATGDQLVKIGDIIGVPRTLQIPSHGAYFTWDDTLDDGWSTESEVAAGGTTTAHRHWYRTGDPLFSLYSIGESFKLSDSDPANYQTLYRRMIQLVQHLRAASRNISTALMVGSINFILFGGTVDYIRIIDNYNMTMDVQVNSTLKSSALDTPDKLVASWIVGGALDLAPAGVRATYSFKEFT